MGLFELDLDVADVLQALHDLRLTHVFLITEINGSLDALDDLNGQEYNNGKQNDVDDDTFQF